MSPEAALVVLTAFGLAYTLSAVVTKISGHGRSDLVAGMPNMNPTARRQAQFERLGDMTRVCR